MAALAALWVVGCDSRNGEVAKPDGEVAKPENEAVGPEAEVERLMAANVPFSFDFTLPDLEGKPVSLAEFDGKVLIVDFWGTWCQPCVMEIPHFIALQEKYADQGLAIVGINYEGPGIPIEEAQQRIASFNAANGVNYTCLIGDDKTQSQIPAFEGYPTTLFLDRNGVVRLKIVGLQKPETLEAAVTTLLAE